jgi:hypothetical protein
MLENYGYRNLKYKRFNLLTKYNFYVNFYKDNVSNFNDITMNFFELSKNYIASIKLPSISFNDVDYVVNGRNVKYLNGVSIDNLEIGVWIDDKMFVEQTLLFFLKGGELYSNSEFYLRYYNRYYNIEILFYDKCLSEYDLVNILGGSKVFNNIDLSSFVGNVKGNLGGGKKVKSIIYKKCFLTNLPSYELDYNSNEYVDVFNLSFSVNGDIEIEYF